VGTDSPFHEQLKRILDDFSLDNFKDLNHSQTGLLNDHGRTVGMS